MKMIESHESIRTWTKRRAKKMMQKQIENMFIVQLHQKPLTNGPDYTDDPAMIQFKCDDAFSMETNAFFRNWWKTSRRIKWQIINGDEGKMSQKMFIQSIYQLERSSVSVFYFHQIIFECVWLFIWIYLMMNWCINEAMTFICSPISLFVRLCISDWQYNCQRRCEIIHF